MRIRFHTLSVWEQRPDSHGLFCHPDYTMTGGAIADWNTSIDERWTIAPVLYLTHLHAGSLSHHWSPGYMYCARRRSARSAP